MDPELAIELLLSKQEELLGFLRRRVASADLARDLLQDCLLRAVRTATSLDDDERVLPWFYAIMRNAVTDVRRHQARTSDRFESSDLDPERAMATVAAPGTDEERELCECYRGLLALMPVDQAALLESVELKEEDAGQVALSLGVSRAALRVRLHRARRTLRDGLTKACGACAQHGCLDCTCSRPA